jgi:hypothetical protein
VALFALLILKILQWGAISIRTGPCSPALLSQPESLLPPFGNCNWPSVHEPVRILMAPHCISIRASRRSGPVRRSFCRSRFSWALCAYQIVSSYMNSVSSPFEGMQKKHISSYMWLTVAAFETDQRTRPTTDDFMDFCPEICPIGGLVTSCHQPFC